VRSRLDEAAWEVARTGGHAMTPEGALEYALSTSPSIPDSRTSSSELLSVLANGFWPRLLRAGHYPGFLDVVLDLGLQLIHTGELFLTAYPPNEANVDDPTV
jgi:hypothetical protein